MTIVTKTAFAAAFLALMAVSAHAQQGPTRQIQVLPAPGAQAALAEKAPAPTEAAAPNAEAAPVAEAAPAPEAAPKVAPAPAPKLAEPKPEPKFVEPKFIDKPARKAFGYAGHGYGKRGPHCH